MFSLDFLFLIISSDCDTEMGSDIVLVMDGSESVGSINFEVLKDFVRNVLKEFVVVPDKYQFGVQHFSDSKLVIHLTH